MTSAPTRVLSRHDLLGASEVLDSGAVLRTADLHDPQAHPVVVFAVEPRLAPEVSDREALLAATRAVYAGIEVVAGPGQALRLVLGERPIDPGALDLALMGCLFERDGRLVGTAAGAAVGHPASDAAATLAGTGERAEPLLVVTGGLIPSVDLRGARSLTAVFSRLGRVGFALRE